MRITRTALVYILTLLSLGCSLNRMVVRSTQGILENSLRALYEEEDIPLAEIAAASDLKLLEGLIKADPENADLLVLAAQGFTGYALAFVEDSDPERAKRFYHRGRDYGLRALQLRGHFSTGTEQGIEGFQKSVQALTDKDLPALFWAANGWAGWIFLNLQSPRALADLPRVEIMMRKVLELDETYYYGGGHLFFGTYYAGRPRMLGGDPEKAQFHFEKNLEISGGRFLMSYVYYARFYAVQIQDRSLFERLLNTVLDTPGDVLPEQRLVNEVAKIKAKNLIQNINEYF